jgi:lipoprotein-anchoring transpeptidase ErfK/SrfK
MTSNPVPVEQALKLAYEALQRGDNQSARRWAQLAARMRPGMEDPWLILATVASPRVSIVYLERALAINPNSERARKGLEWARRRLMAQAQPAQPKERAEASRVALPAEPEPVLQGRKPSMRSSRTSLLVMLGLLILFVSAAWVFWPALGSSALAAVRNQPAATQDSPILSWVQENLMPPSQTPSLTPTSSPTATASPTATPTATATFTPTATETPLPTDTPAPPDWLMDGEYVIPQFPEGGEKLIVVSIGKQHLWAYQDGELVFSFIASTGMDNATRPGSYSVLDKIPNAYASTWNIWMPNWLGIYPAGNLENGIHGLPIMQNGRRLWSGVLGAPISYGCVVLGVEESLALYDWAEVGTSVQIDY